MKAIADFENALSELGSEDDPVVFEGHPTTAREVWYRYKGLDIMDAPISYWASGGRYVRDGTVRGFMRDRGWGGPGRCPHCGRFIPNE